MLERNLEIAEKTLKITKKLHRAQVWARIFHAIKWLIIIGLLVFGFIEIQPYLNTMLQASQQIFQMVGQVNDQINKINNLVPKNLLR